MSWNFIDFPPWRKKQWPSSKCRVPDGGSRSPGGAASARLSCPQIAPSLEHRSRGRGSGQSSGSASTGQHPDFQPTHAACVRWSAPDVPPHPQTLDVNPFCFVIEFTFHPRKTLHFFEASPARGGVAMLTRTVFIESVGR